MSDSGNGAAMASARRDSKADLAIVEKLREARQRVREQMKKVVVGQETVIDSMLIGLLCKGHVLLHGVPGLGKTLMARTLATTLNMDFRRIQFTPDLMPSDITGTDVLEEDPATGRQSVKFMQGPIFTNFLLADEINRTPPKTQAALLQAMQESEITIGRETYKLKPPFFVVATQNPIEMEGTYPLPEAQVDRFMFSLKVKYPTVEELLRLQDLIRGVPVADSVVRYAATLTAATRPGQGVGDPALHKYISYGASPRASQYVVLGAKARAIIEGRYHVDFADIRAVAHNVYRHRLVLNFHARADGLDADALIDRLLKGVKES